MIIYIDETGDLGLNLSLKRTSKFFVLTAIIFFEVRHAKRVMKEVERFKIKYEIYELKGKSTPLANKLKLFKYLKKHEWILRSLVIKKSKATFIKNPNSFYDQALGEFFKSIIAEFPFQKIELIIDRCKNSDREIKLCNKQVMKHIVSFEKCFKELFIRHSDSEAEVGLQLADFFSYGIFKNFETGDNNWLKVFKKRVKITKR